MSGQAYPTAPTIVAVYDTPAHAELAVQDLLEANIPESAIERHTDAGSFTGRTAAEPAKKPGGFLSSLFGSDTHEDADTYRGSMSRGGTVVTVGGVPEADFDRIAIILEQHNPVEFDDHRTNVDVAGRDTAAYAPTALATPAAVDGETVQLSEENLVVGKRLVNRGGTRIRRYVVETPVDAQVALHDERVVVERRPVADGRAVDAGAFSNNDKVIEMTETAEVPVVGKTARVVEEVSLRREGVDRTETVHDTVRKEEVEITETAGETLVDERPLGGAARRV